MPRWYSDAHVGREYADFAPYCKPPSCIAAHIPLEYPRQWVEVYRARHDRPKLLAALRDVTRGFVGITDMPGVHFIQELCEIYPDAKVICVRRDSKRWLRSAQHMSDKMTAWYMPVLMWPMPAARWFATWLELAVARTGEMGLLPFDEGERPAPDCLTCLDCFLLGKQRPTKGDNYKQGYVITNAQD
jgi:hypothetical protein